MKHFSWACTKIDYKYTYVFCMKNICYVLTVMGMVTVQNFELMSDKFNVVRICINVNYGHKWITVYIIINI
jgi:hypothetical protein